LIPTPGINRLRLLENWLGANIMKLSFNIIFMYSIPNHQHPKNKRPFNVAARCEKCFSNYVNALVQVRFCQFRNRVLFQDPASKNQTGICKEL
jgi:hypothetical protein